MDSRYQRSVSMGQAAAKHLPGGVCSSTRLNRALGRPFIAERGAGSRVWDADGNAFIDLCCGHGAALLGHAHPAIDEAVRKAVGLGHLCAFETEYHGELAARVCERVPCAEMVRFTGSGTEATMHALRLCRAATGREKVLRVEGHFHGYHDQLYIGGHPPADRQPDNRRQPYVESAGIPAAFADYIIPLPFNDLPAAEAAMDQHGADCCALILEPVNFNSGGLLPEPGYLAGLRKLCDASGVLLFFDEVQTSFKACRGGAQEAFGVVPDLCCLGKALGGGLPLSAIAGPRALMELYQPVGPVQHSGTFNAPLASVLASLAFLNEIVKPGFYEHLDAIGEQFVSGLLALAAKHGVPLSAPRHGARCGLVFGGREPLRRYEDVMGHDRELALAFFRSAHEQGVYFHDYGGQACHHGWSSAHTAADIDEALAKLDAAMAGL